MNKYVVAIDPSMHSTGIAIFEDEQLIETKCIEVDEKIIGFHALVSMSCKATDYANAFTYRDCVFVIEEQVRHKKDRMSMEDFVKLASISYIIGCDLAYNDNIFFVQPSQWKKQLPKKIHHGRLMANEIKLGTDIKLLQDRQPDIMDAIGIGRWYYANHK